MNEWQETFDYIVCLSMVQHCMLVDWVAPTKLKPQKLTLRAVSDFSWKLALLKNESQ